MKYTLLLLLFSLTGFSQTPEKFIAKYSNIATMQQKSWGVPASVQLAVGMLISENETKIFAKDWNNTFKIECFSNTCNTGHCYEYEHKHFYKYYYNVIDCWNDNARRIHNLNWSGANNYVEYCEMLEKRNYFEDSFLDKEKVIKIIKKYKLDKYDVH